MIEFTKFAKIKDNYCICYFGSSNEYLVQLSMIHSSIERQLSGINLYIGCKDSSSHLIDGIDKKLFISEIKVRRAEFAHINELTYNGKVHPVLQLLESSQLIVPSIPQKEKMTQKCVIVSNGSYPTGSLIEKNVIALKKLAIQRGFVPEINGEIENAGWVVGVESLKLYQAVQKGIPTSLVPTGIGTPLYKMLSPEGEILNIGT